jgi:hypothetical protein
LGACGLSTAIIGLAVSLQTQLAALAALVIGGVPAKSAWMHRTGHKGSPAPAGVGLPGAR